MNMKNLMMNKIIDKHINHKLTYIKGPFGPHRGKFVCVPCNKFIKWAKSNEVKTYKKITENLETRISKT